MLIDSTSCNVDVESSTYSTSTLIGSEAAMNKSVMKNRVEYLLQIKKYDSSLLDE